MITTKRVQYGSVFLTYGNQAVRIIGRPTLWLIFSVNQSRLGYCGVPHILGWYSRKGLSGASLDFSLDQVAFFPLVPYQLAQLQDTLANGNLIHYYVARYYGPLLWLTWQLNPRGTPATPLV
jgi:hypothetical protein